MRSEGRISKAAALALFLAFILVASSHPALAADRILIYFDGHMHTTRSDGSGNVDQIKEAALNRGLNAVIITDHCKSLTMDEWESLVDETALASDGAFLAIPSFEVTGSDGLFNRDHMLAIGVKDPFVGKDDDELCPEEVWPSPENPYGTGPMYPENLTKWVDYIHSKGGIAVYNHPSGMVRSQYGVNCMEVYNQGHVDDIASYAMTLGYSPAEALGFGYMLNNLTLYGEASCFGLPPNQVCFDSVMPTPAALLYYFPSLPSELPLRDILFYATYLFTYPNGAGQWLGAPQVPLNSWDDLLMDYVNGVVDTPVFGMADSDSHNTGNVEENGYDPSDPNYSTVGRAKNGVYLNELTENELYKALKAGRFFATTGPSLDVAVNGEQMGDTAYIFDGVANVTLSVNSESGSAILFKIDVIKNGVIIKTINPMTPTFSTSFADSATSDGYYRVEVTAINPATSAFSFAYSNPVFVRVE
jgi:hypothetical protein